MKDELLYQAAATAAAAVVSSASQLYSGDEVRCLILCSLFLFNLIFVSKGCVIQKLRCKPQHIFRKELHNTRPVSLAI